MLRLRHFLWHPHRYRQHARLQPPYLLGVVPENAHGARALQVFAALVAFVNIVLHAMQFPLFWRALTVSFAPTGYFFNVDVINLRHVLFYGDKYWMFHRALQCPACAAPGTCAEHQAVFPKRGETPSSGAGEEAEK